MKKYFNTAILIGAILMLVGIALPLISALLIPKDVASIGIIGGADVPTSMYLTYQFWLGSFNYTITRLGFAVVLTGVLSRIFNKTICENCTVKTSLYALGVSIFSACGFYCFFETFLLDLRDNPLSFSVCKIGFIISIILCIFLLVLYIISYIKDKKYKRIIFDTVIIILYFGAFVDLASRIHSLLSSIMKLIGI